MTREHIAALRELADDLDSIVQVVSTRDGDATARQHQRASAVRAALAALASPVGETLGIQVGDVVQLGGFGLRVVPDADAARVLTGNDGVDAIYHCAWRRA